MKDGYLRLELPVIEGTQVKVHAGISRQPRRRLCAGNGRQESECGFAQFRTECLAATWECYRCFYRNSRYQGRHRELHLVDSIDPEGLRFITLDGVPEEPVFFTATGMDPALTQLFPDGRTVRQRRLVSARSSSAHRFIRRNSRCWHWKGVGEVSDER